MIEIGASFVEEQVSVLRLKGYLFNKWTARSLKESASADYQTDCDPDDRTNNKRIL